MTEGNTMRYALIGAHLGREDVAGVDDVDVLSLDRLVLSAIRFDPSAGLADSATIAKAARVRGELLSRETFIAIRYGSSVAGRDGAHEKCAGFEASWERILTRYRGMVEMTLKVASGVGELRPDRRSFSSGRAYLEALHESRRGTAVGEDFRAWIESRLGDLAVRGTWSRRDDLATEFAFLIRREDVAAAKDAGIDLKAAFPDVPFLLSGPWPLETFANEE